MTGRGKLCLLRHSSNPLVTIGISLSTSPSSLSAASEEPFYVVVTARILTTPHPEQPISLWTHLSPLDHLSTRAFWNIKCTSNEAKIIKIWPDNWSHYCWYDEDLPNHGDNDFVTIPPRDEGTVSVRHQVPPDLIRAAKVVKGERYRVKLSDVCLGAKWWTYGSMENLEGVRLRYWRSPDEGEEYEMWELHQEHGLTQEKRDIYRQRFDWLTTMGEDHCMLALVDEGPMEFEVT